LEQPEKTTAANARMGKSRAVVRFTRGIESEVTGARVGVRDGLQIDP
jgi:hypothetical protein